MAGLTGHRNITNGLSQMLLLAELGIKVDALQAADEAAKAGADAVRRTIDTTESSLRPGKMNRNWTFQMRQSVSSRVRRSGNTIHIRAGWLDNREGYFLKQEYGGPFGNTTITPMNALMAGHNAMLDTLKGWGFKTK